MVCNSRLAAPIHESMMPCDQAHVAPAPAPSNGSLDRAERPIPTERLLLRIGVLLGMHSCRCCG
eukprot:1557471-Alexandrium_andersonii.AAC.1